jgi:hypothetical protein
MRQDIPLKSTNTCNMCTIQQVLLRLRARCLIRTCILGCRKARCQAPSKSLARPLEAPEAPETPLEKPLEAPSKSPLLRILRARTTQDISALRVEVISGKRGEFGGGLLGDCGWALSGHNTCPKCTCSGWVGQQTLTWHLILRVRASNARPKKKNCESHIYNDAFLMMHF